MLLVWYRRTPWFGLSDPSFVRELLEVVSNPQKQNDSSGTKATQELFDPQAIYPRKLNIPTVVCCSAIALQVENRFQD
jgi:hypothetical protein